MQCDLRENMNYKCPLQNMKDQLIILILSKRNRCRGTFTQDIEYNEWP